ncbi:MULTISPECIES: hypothetical protein [Burkholderia]|uniref:hypothetical protein n=1 Tax=Burkholderia TaxID=32008 RepID=UPI001269C397|nr:MULTISPECIES: hypothetical protein [Burkholderia]
MRDGFRQLRLPGNRPDVGRIAVSALRAEIDVTVCIVSGNPVRAPNRQYLEALAFVEIPAVPFGDRATPHNPRRFYCRSWPGF